MTDSQLTSRAAGALAALAGAATLIGAGSPIAHGSIGATLTFHLAFVVLVALALPNPRSHAYSALATVLVLGFWTKFLIRLLGDYPYLEPVGHFDGTAAAWDRVLWTISAAITGVILVRAVQLVIARTRPQRPPHVDGHVVPDAYRWHVRLIWSATGLVTAATYLWNWYASVYVTGVNARIVLPLKGNAVLGAWLLIGCPIWFALLIGWESARRGDHTLGWDLLWIPLAEGVTNAASLLSRVTYLLHTLPYFLAPTHTTGSSRIRGSRLVNICILAGGFAASLVAVTLIRNAVYPNTLRTLEQAVAPYNPSAARAIGARRRALAIHQIGTLVFDRWTGMEGVMAVTAAPDLPRAIDVVREDPSKGTAAFYQRVAQSTYATLSNFTFLTLAGSVALLAFTRSFTLVLFGMAMLTAILMTTETAARRWIGNEILCATVGILGAFTVSQATFPRLLAIFIVELWAVVGSLACVQHALSRSSQHTAGSTGDNR